VLSETGGAAERPLNFRRSDSEINHYISDAFANLHN